MNEKMSKDEVAEFIEQYAEAAGFSGYAERTGLYDLPGEELKRMYFEIYDDEPEFDF